jgi:acetyltransferase
MDTHRLADGTEIFVRPIGPDDEPLIEELHERHSAHTIRMRFFGLVRHLSRESLTRLCRLDPSREAALAALHQGADGRPHIIGVSRYYLTPETGEAEFAVVVTDEWQGRGVGWILMRRLENVARPRGVKRLVGDVLRENATMLQLMTALGYTVRLTDDPAVVQAVKDIDEPEALATENDRR